MPLLPLPELRAALPRDARLIGIDPGRRTIGLALSDVLLMLATPYRAIPRGKLAANAAEIRARAKVLREPCGAAIASATGLRHCRIT
ncbi:Holliday junction resolvase RuvX, partial [Roseomonas mucosa]|uniref:Holliday junction resolvase RuvX n=1 Tax=Roseomonas mucosa TaxID=207340 RepID=UPI0039EF9843